MECEVNPLVKETRTNASDLKVFAPDLVCSLHDGIDVCLLCQRLRHRVGRCPRTCTRSFRPRPVRPALLSYRFRNHPLPIAQHSLGDPVGRPHRPVSPRSRWSLHPPSLSLSHFNQISFLLLPITSSHTNTSLSLSLSPIEYPCFSNYIISPFLSNNPNNQSNPTQQHQKTRQ